jgi:hypothetical protein
MHSRGNEHLWAKAIAAGEVEASPARQRFRAPLTSVEMRAMYLRNRTPEVRALLWEVARLHAIVRRANQLAACFPLYDNQTTASSFHIILEALRRELALEPCIHRDAHAIAGQWPEELVDAIGPGRQVKSRRR